jgi:hypothetical protein
MALDHVELMSTRAERDFLRFAFAASSLFNERRPIAFRGRHRGSGAGREENLPLFLVDISMPDNYTFYDSSMMNLVNLSLGKELPNGDAILSESDVV